MFEYMYSKWNKASSSVHREMILQRKTAKIYTLFSINKEQEECQIGGKALKTIKQPLFSERNYLLIISLELFLVLYLDWYRLIKFDL